MRAKKKINGEALQQNESLMAATLESTADGLLAAGEEPRRDRETGKLLTGEMAVIAAAQLYQELKETETSLRESESRFRAIFEKAAVGVAEIEMGTGRFLTVNRWFCELVGRTKEELLATTFQAITHPEDLHRHEAKMALLVAGKIGSYELEKRYIRKDGVIICVNLTISPLWKPEEAPTRNLIVVQDVTERRRIQEENERRARQLTVLYETSVELTAELNLNALLQTIVQHAMTLIGGESCNLYIYKAELDQIERVAIAGKELMFAGKRRHRGDGVLGQVWATGAPLLINDYHAWPGRKKEYDHFPSRALVAVPVLLGGEFLGVLNILAYAPHRFTEADVDVLAMFATQAAIAIRNARLHDHMKKELAERKRAEEALRESEERYRTLVDNASDIVFKTDNTGHFTFVNPAGIRIVGYTEKEVIGRHYPTLIRPDMREEAIRFFGIQFVKGLENTYSEYPVITKEGGEIWLGQNTKLIVQDGHVEGFQAMARDITALKRAEQALKDSEQRYRELSMIDDLTQLYNSRHFYVQLKSETERSNRYGQPLTLLLLDLDNFKAFNDAYGHVEGDQVLSRLGQVVKRCLRETDSAYRYGGEEFTILLPMTTSGEGVVTAERIRTEFRKEVFSPASGQEVHMTVSIGCAQYRTKEEMKAFVHRVDQWMYQGKKNGKDRVCSAS
jgi:diguanylate cyclase (GGDEF)-like protein/PAS domain S-box-containing protein